MAQDIRILLPEIKENVSLAQYTTFRIGGPARYFFAAKTKDDIVYAFEAAQKADVPVFILGGGSNILVSDEGFPGLVIKIELQGIEFRDEGEERVQLIAAAGEPWDTLVGQTVERGLYGIENLSGIPGTVGAAPVQNIGAYGVEVQESISWVDVFDPKEIRFERITKDECIFGYRDSIFKKPEGQHFTIVSVGMMLTRAGELRTHYKDVSNYISEHKLQRPTLADVRGMILEIRKKKFPDLSLFGTAGSFFKNSIIPKDQYRELLKSFPLMPSYEVDSTHVKVSTAWILDAICNLKGKKVGAVGAFERQPLVLVNFGGATAKGVKEFANSIVTIVKGKTGIDLEYEVQLVGSF